MNSTNDRRTFLKTTVAGGLVAPWVGWKSTAAEGKPSDQLRFVCFGAAGRAWGNINSMAGVKNTGFVAVADVDTSRARQVREKFPDTKVYQDWRELLDKEHKNFDVAIVSTPDHMHAPIAMSALQLGKHTYCEKPLTRNLHECRALQTFAAENGLATQMGIQVGSSVGNKTAVKWLNEGIVGKVKAVHSMNPKSWGQMTPMGSETHTPPETLNWDQWIGVRGMRPFVERAYHPSQWRKRLDFGTGTLGDMGCHILHPWYQGLRQPEVVEVVSLGDGPVDEDSWPLNSHIRWRLKGNELTEGDFDAFWYDGSKFPAEEVISLVGVRENVPKSGSLVVGTNGVLTIPHGGGMPALYRDGTKVPEVKNELAVAGSHHGDFAAYIRGESKAKPLANWDYSGPMTEVVLLGNVAIRNPGETLQWSSKDLKFTNSDKATEMVKETYRKGWEVKGI